MKKLLVSILSLFFGATSYAQDKVVLKNGEELNVKVVKNNEKTIEFQYPGESMINEKNKREIKKIVYESGREEIFNELKNEQISKDEKEFLEVELKQIMLKIAKMK